MKKAGYQRRFYRDWIKSRGLFIKRITDKESDLQIVTERPLDEVGLKEKIRLYRSQIEDYISKERRFLTALKPLEVELDAPLIIRRMAEAAKKTGTGPMAAVAGAIADFLGKGLLRKGHKEVIIENGGDIFLKLKKERKVLIYSGRSKLLRGLALKIKPEDTPLGLCTSSGKIGHSLSFGTADAVTILAKSSALADAVATATCNRIKCKQDLQAALDFARVIKGVLGVVIIFENSLLSWGRVEFGLNS